MTFLSAHPEWSDEPFLDSLRLQQEAANVGFDWEHTRDVIDKVREEIEELNNAIRANNRDASHHELGDLFLALVNIARMLKLDPHVVMRDANERFRHRFVSMETILEQEGRTVQQSTFEELNRAWESAKRADRSK